MFRQGQVVGIVRPRNTGLVYPQGLYRVVARDRRVTELECLDSGRRRRFSSLTGVERDGISVSFDTAKIVEVDEYQQAVEQFLNHGPATI